MSIVLNCGVSAALFDVPLTRRAVVGVGLVVGSTFVFQSVKPKPSAAGWRNGGGGGGGGAVEWEEHSAHEALPVLAASDGRGADSPPRRDGTPKSRAGGAFGGGDGESPPPSVERPKSGSGGDGVERRASCE